MKIVIDTEPYGEEVSNHVVSNQTLIEVMQNMNDFRALLVGLGWYRYVERVSVRFVGPTNTIGRHMSIVLIAKTSEQDNREWKEKALISLNPERIGIKGMPERMRDATRDALRKMRLDFEKPLRTLPENLYST